MYRSKGALFFILFVFAGAVHGNDYASDSIYEVGVGNGTNLKRYCNEYDHKAHDADWMLCVAIVDGVINGMLVGETAAYWKAFPNEPSSNKATPLKSSFDYCTPFTATPESKALIVTEYLRSHPNDLDKQYGFAIRDAFIEAWPCKTESKK
ncbi:MAG TPA: Rap1a/Tai family immunity protein [Gammaproteobacteria bacterium]